MSSRTIAVIGTLALAAVLGGGQAAAASQGSVPAEVVAYASDPDGLLARLDDLAGVGSNGQGIDFEGAKAGQLNRVFEFTDAFAAGEQTETPVQRANQWTAPILVGDKPLGLAVIWIDQSTLDPDLADFTEGASLAAALMDVPADATLVRDAPRGAWFTLVGEELTPLVPGTSGVETAVPLAAYQDALATAPPATPAASAVPELSIVVIIVSVLVIAAVLLVPSLRARRRGAPAAAVESAAAPPPPVVSPTAKAPAAKPPAAQPASAKSPAKTATKTRTAKRTPEVSPAE